MNMSDDFLSREFPMSDTNFKIIQDLAYQKIGIKLSPYKKNMIYSRLSRRLRSLNLKNFDDYCDIICHPEQNEIVEFINAVTTNLTSFFREPYHFDYIKNIFIPSVIKDKNENKRLRIWSAGCSTGEEAYSLAMIFCDLPTFKKWDIKILATDVDSNVVDIAKKGVYSADKLYKIPVECKNYVTIDYKNEDIKIKEIVKKMITFKQLNLMHRWPMKGPFDIIFCRNVIIYFDVETQKKLFNRYADMLCEEGKLFIGHSENLYNISEQFQAVGHTIYYKKRRSLT